ncbi:MAG: glycine dehydrogenase subunit 2 [Chloroflexi bacterium]|nr:MAG: glycine dehydrogenase subunit 2 [Chloroflexota bacterium]
MSEDVGARLAFDRGAPGRRGVGVPRWQGEPTALPDTHLLRESVRLPEMSQNEVIRYFGALSRRNYSIDTGTYPLGSCTMKYNPKVNDLIAGLAGFANAHPLAPTEHLQGVLRVLFELQSYIGEITGLPAVSLAGAAGAQGELAGILIVKRALERRGDLAQRRRVLVPDSAHGTNPATAAMAGFTVQELKSGPDGCVDMAALEAALGDDVAAFMITLPNTLGLWERDIQRIVQKVHEAGAYVYGDGANLNAILGRMRFGDLGFDVVHLNPHKTFSTPHGGGGPGAGPVCATPELAAFLPAPVVTEEDGRYMQHRPEDTIGRMQQFHGSVGVLLRAYAYLRIIGVEGLRETSGNAVLNANYLRALMGDHYDLPYDRRVMHEVVFSGDRQKRSNGITTYDIAKRVIDHGLHPPTVYFPLIVHEALMIEPTEAESRESIEALAQAFIEIAEEAERDPDALHAAPQTAPIGRMDETEASRHPVIRWQPRGE